MTEYQCILTRERTSLLLMFCSLAMLHQGNTECESRCGVDRPITTHGDTRTCPIRIPDNPYHRGDLAMGDIIPCQIEIQSNCSGFCHIELSFNKFDLPACAMNVTDANESCEIVNSCEYVLLHEVGTDPQGANITQLTHFHGNYTQQKYVSRTDKVLLQFCYRSETFTGRNIQVEFRTFNPFVKQPFYAGPVSVYILCFLVILFIAAICIIRWNKTVRQCLENPPEGKKRHYVEA